MTLCENDDSRITLPVSLKQNVFFGKVTSILINQYKALDYDIWYTDIPHRLWSITRFWRGNQDYEWAPDLLTWGMLIWRPLPPVHHIFASWRRSWRTKTPRTDLSRAAASHWVIPKSSPWLTMGATFTIPSHGRLMVSSQGFPLESRIWNLAM